MTSCHTFDTFTRIVMLIKQFVRKNALSILVLVNQQHPQLNGTKRVELEIVYARVHLLNEGGLYKIDQTKKDVLTSCSFITSRADTDALANINATVNNKVHIGPQFEYIISKCLSVSKTLFHSVHHMLKLINSQPATTSYPSDCSRTHARERRGSTHCVSPGEWELYRTWHLRDSAQYPQIHNTFQAL